MIEYNGRLIPETFQEIVDPKHTALIVHELLHDFVTEGGVFDQLGIRVDASGIVPPIVKLISAARKKILRSYICDSLIMLTIVTITNL